jgi:hypothetical protein
MNSMKLPAPYAARSIRFLELWEEAGWRMKIYGISYRPGGPSARLVATARELARRTLPQPAVRDGRYGVGFIGVHAGRSANLVFVDWWADENELHHHVFTAPGHEPLAFDDVTGSGLAACVWDLAVLGFERQCWIGSMLLEPAAHGLESYLACRFEGSI